MEKDGKGISTLVVSPSPRLLLLSWTKLAFPESVKFYFLIVLVEGSHPFLYRAFPGSVLMAIPGSALGVNCDTGDDQSQLSAMQASCPLCSLLNLNGRLIFKEKFKPWLLKRQGIAAVPAICTDTARAAASLSDSLSDLNALIEAKLAGCRIHSAMYARNAHRAMHWHPSPDGLSWLRRTQG